VHCGFPVAALDSGRLVGGSLAYLDFAVVRAADEPVAVGTEAQAVYHLRVALVRLYTTFPPHIPYLRRRSHADGGT